MGWLEGIVKLCQVFVNDKVLVIVMVSGLTALCVIMMPQKADTIVTSAFTGLFGIAVGTSLKRSNDVNITNGGTKP